MRNDKMFRVIIVTTQHLLKIYGTQLGLPLNHGKYSCIFRVSIFLSSLHNGMYLNKDVRSLICAEAATDFRPMWCDY